MCCMSKITLCMGPAAPPKPHGSVHPSPGSSRIKNMYLLHFVSGVQSWLRITMGSDICIYVGRQVAVPAPLVLLLSCQGTGQTSVWRRGQGEAGCQTAQQVGLFLVIFFNILPFSVYCLSAARTLGHHLLPSHLLIFLSTASLVMANVAFEGKGSWHLLRGIRHGQSRQIMEITWEHPPPLPQVNQALLAPSTVTVHSLISACYC